MSFQTPENGTITELDLLKLMFLSREGDRREQILHRQSKGWFQVSGDGNEGLALFTLQMKKSDIFSPYYRDRALVLGKGMPNKDLASAYFAKAGSSSEGRQMPGHYSDRELGVWSVPTPTGSNLLPAAGMAWAYQLRKEPNIVLATVGDLSLIHI